MTLKFNWSSEINVAWWLEKKSTLDVLLWTQYSDAAIEPSKLKLYLIREELCFNKDYRTTLQMLNWDRDK